MPSRDNSSACRNCARLRRPDATGCGFCGTATTLLPASVPTFPMPEVGCPVCGGPVPLYALGCEHCGQSFEHRDSRHRARRLKDDRSVLVQLAATASVVVLFVTPFFFFEARGTGSWVAWTITAGLFVVGMALATLGAVVAFRDLMGMSAGRVETDGRSRTLFAGVAAGLAVLSHWIAAGCGVYTLL